MDEPTRGKESSARAAALARLASHAATPTSLVGYQSEGRVAVLGSETRAAEVARALPHPLSATVIGLGESDFGMGVGFIRARVVSVDGHLGQFRIVGPGETLIAPSVLSDERPFDLVLDLSEDPLITSEVPPPGYYHAPESAALERALAALPDMVGEFEKPRYFRYDPDICVHGARGITACTRCLDACPSDAIRSVGERVEVDPYLCQGGGVCASVCPSGAMRYAYPSAEDLLDGMRSAFAAYRELSDEAPTVLIHDREVGGDWVERHESTLPDSVIPCEVEELGSLGSETWLVLLAYGAQAVWLLESSPLPHSVRTALDGQMNLAHALLEGLGYPASCIAWRKGDSIRELPVPSRPGCPPAHFAAIDEKRTLLAHAIDHLAAHAPSPSGSTSLPAGSPFGTIEVDTTSCTLCMACPSVCPARALAAGGELPALRFVEWNCVQCGLCEKACPEGSIRRVPRFLYDADARLETRVLNEDRAFHCIRCGKPFATAKIIERMTDKLSAHWMFQKPEAVLRLQMCEDCRVKDMFKDGGGMLDMGSGPGSA